MNTFRPTLWFLPRGLRVCGVLLMLPMILAGCVSSGSWPHEVTVYSYVTASGRNVSAATSDRPVSCLLVDGGYREIGDTPRSGGRHALDPSRIAALLHEGLAGNHYRCIGKKDTVPALVVVFHWGHAAPESFQEERRTPSMADLQMLDLVGGRGLANADLKSERQAIFSATTEERFFVSVAAYAYAEGAAENIGELLWRTQMSVRTDGLVAEQAMPMLTAIGGTFFGRETPLPRRIDVSVTGVLRRRAVSQR
ncbi:MAG: hypothetical protein V4773_03545 [Verrucomicrobiota bacterium]